MVLANRSSIFHEEERFFGVAMTILEIVETDYFAASHGLSHSYLAFQLFL